MLNLFVGRFAGNAPTAALCLQGIVRSYRLLKRNGRNPQFAVHVKNFESLHDLVACAIRMASVREVRTFWQHLCFVPKLASCQMCLVGACAVTDDTTTSSQPEHSNAHITLQETSRAHSQPAQHDVTPSVYTIATCSLQAALRDIAQPLAHICLETYRWYNGQLDPTPCCYSSLCL